MPHPETRVETHLELRSAVRHGPRAVIPLATITVVALLLSACAPRFYQRETLNLDHADFDALEIRYASMDGCLLRREVPVSYRLRRPQYQLGVDISFGNAPGTASLVLSLSGDNHLAARFLDIPQPPAKPLDEGVRYRVEAATIPDGRLRFEVLRNDQTLERQTLQVTAEHCRAMSLGEGD